MGHIDFILEMMSQRHFILGKSYFNNTLWIFGQLLSRSVFDGLWEIKGNFVLICIFNFKMPLQEWMMTLGFKIWEERLFSLHHLLEAHVICCRHFKILWLLPVVWEIWIFLL